MSFENRAGIFDTPDGDEAYPYQDHSVDLLYSLSPEHLEHAEALVMAMADKFSTPEKPLDYKDFGFVAVDQGGKQAVFVMLTTPRGLDCYSYNQLMHGEGAQEAYSIEIGDTTIDTRHGLSWEAYKAFITQAANHDVEPMPDSAAYAQSQNLPFSHTWLTGEVPDTDYAKYGYSYNGEPRHFLTPRRINTTSDNICFRPTVRLV